MLDVAIVGGGIFGQVAAAHLRRTGRDVLVVDDARSGAGSPPAGCVIKPGWLIGKMSRDEVAAALALLDQLYGLRNVEFRTQLGAKVKCHRVEPSVVLNPAVVTGKATRVTEREVFVDEDDPSLQAVAEARHVVVATGVWARDLCPWAPAVSARWGWSFRGPPVTEPRIYLWAPYRQVVSFNMDDGRSWLGDGSALVHRSEARRRAAEGRVRVHSALPPQALLSPPLEGARPVVPGLARPAYLERGPDGVWCLTGGGKNGTAAAAWAALELDRRLY